MISSEREKAALSPCPLCGEEVVLQIYHTPRSFYRCECVSCSYKTGSVYYSDSGEPFYPHRNTARRIAKHEHENRCLHLRAER